MGQNKQETSQKAVVDAPHRGRTAGIGDGSGNDGGSQSVEEVATEHFWRHYVKSALGIVPSDDES